MSDLHDIPVSTASHSRPEGPFEHLMMDFIELTHCEGYKYCLVIVDMFSKWIEAFTCRRATAVAAAKAVVREIIPREIIPKATIPRYGLPSKISTTIVDIS